MAASLVRNGKVCCDIGTDHAYLPTYLVMKNIVPGALACDLRKGPLGNAKNTVTEYGVEDKIILRLSDGLDKVNPDEAEDFVFCGMGGNLITDILSRAEWLKDSKYRLVIQPQSHSEDVRRFLAKNGFKIFGDLTCEDAGKVYTAFAAEYTGECINYSEGFFYVGNIPNIKSESSMKYLEAVLKRLKTKRDAQKEYGDAETASYLDTVIKEIEEKCDDNS